MQGGSDLRVWSCGLVHRRVCEMPVAVGSLLRPAHDGPKWIM
jgi:hypothetical protein